MSVFGTLCLFGGGFVTLYFLIGFDVSVPGGVGSIVNLGLLNDRQAGVMVGLAALIVGAIFLAAGEITRNSRRTPRCPSCRAENPLPIESPAARKRLAD